MHLRWIFLCSSRLIKGKKRSFRMMLLVVLVITSMSGVNGYKTYQTLIPNGDKVPHPCGEGGVWSGVGHLNPDGTGARNVFGKDFLDGGAKWSQELCEKDSDFDGRTNGEELGDPKCEWMSGDTPAYPPMSHPGICEPVDNATCIQTNSAYKHYLMCDHKMNDNPCPALSEPDTKNLTMRFSQSRIYPQVTSYMCMVYDLPTDGDFHLVATTPNVNNSAIVHHMILFGCDFPDDFNQTLLYMMKSGAYRCGMTPHEHCNQFLATWTYGFDGECMAPNTGFRIGKYGTRVAALQVHWHNPEKLADQTDSSGMTIYYTPAAKRSYDASTFIVGQEYLNIPPKQVSTTFTAQCPSTCTSEMWNEKIYVTRAVNHMHYYGRKQRISIFRNGTRIRDLTNDDNYDYDAPFFYFYDPPIEVLPGDDIVTECTYGSDDKSTITFGAGTHNEMCYGFITYYPIQNFLPTICIQWKSVQRCVRKLPKFNGMYNGCDWRSFADKQPNSLAMRTFSEASCGSYWKTKQCSDQCVKDSNSLLGHPCLRGDLGDWLEKRAGIPLNILRTCASKTNSAQIIGHQSFTSRFNIFLYFCTILWTFS